MLRFRGEDARQSPARNASERLISCEATGSLAPYASLTRISRPGGSHPVGDSAMNPRPYRLTLFDAEELGCDPQAGWSLHFVVAAE